MKWVEDLLGGKEEVRIIVENTMQTACDNLYDDLSDRGVGDEEINDVADVIWKEMCKTIK